MQHALSWLHDPTWLQAIKGPWFLVACMAAAFPVYWLLRLLRIKHSYDLGKLAGLMLVVVPLTLFVIAPLAVFLFLLICQMLG
jgi:hypothetical protein